MDSMRLSGLATGLDTSSIIEQLMGLERRPIRLMETNQAKVQNRLDLFRQLNTKLSALERAADSLMGTSLSLSSFSGTKAVSGNSALFTASSDTGAAAGTFNIEVMNLASAQKNGYGNYTAGTTGTLTIQEGANPAITVNITAGTIEGVVAEINGANAGMSAAVFDDGLGNANSKKIVLTGAKTGVTYTVGGTAAVGIGVDTVQSAAVQAQVEIDGNLVTSNSNTITSALSGVTLNLVAAGTSTLTVSKDQSGAVAKVKDFIDKYNDVVDFLEKNSSYDDKTKRAGAFLGDSMTSGIRMQLSRLATDLVNPVAPATDPNGYSSYATNVGIELTREGTLKLDETKLTAALAASPNLVYDLFSKEEGSAGVGSAKRVVVGAGATAGDGIAVRISGYVQSLIKTGGDYLAAGQDGSLLGAIKGMEKTIDGFDDRIEAYERRLELRERSLRAQFTAMERSVSMLRSQGSYMTNQLGGMAGG